jgi:hypothetical protein
MDLTQTDPGDFLETLILKVISTIKSAWEDVSSMESIFQLQFSKQVVCPRCRSKGPKETLTQLFSFHTTKLDSLQADIKKQICGPDVDDHTCACSKCAENMAANFGIIASPNFLIITFD